MKFPRRFLILILLIFIHLPISAKETYIRINQLGYLPEESKIVIGSFILQRVDLRV